MIIESSNPTHWNGINSSLAETQKAALQKIAELFDKDPVEKHLKDVEPSTCDRLAFRGMGEIVTKSYFQLKSGRVVEVVNFKDHKAHCIGSFTYTAEECSRDGWATYHALTDKQWSDIVTAFTQEKPLKRVDWSCGWNCMQNLFYIKTRIKISLLELFQCVIQNATQKAETVLKLFKDAKSTEELQKLIGEKMKDFVLILGFFSDPLFSTSNIIEELLLGSKQTNTQQGDWLNVESISASKLIEQLKAYSCLKDGPLLLTAGPEGHLLYADESGNMTIVDPHNLERSSNYCAQSTIKELSLPYSTAKGFLIKAQDATGKARNYRGCTGVTGLSKDVNVETLQKMLIEIRAKGVLHPESIAKEIAHLRDILQQCEEALQKISPTQ